MVLFLDWQWCTTRRATSSDKPKAGRLASYVTSGCFRALRCSNQKHLGTNYVWLRLETQPILQTIVSLKYQLSWQCCQPILPSRSVLSYLLHSFFWLRMAVMSSHSPQSLIFQVICLASQATGPQLPHLGRAFTDVQEMRQVIWQACVMGWEVGWTIIELNHELLFFWRW